MSDTQTPAEICVCLHLKGPTAAGYLLSFFRSSGGLGLFHSRRSLQNCGVGAIGGLRSAGGGLYQ